MKLTKLSGWLAIAGLAIVLPPRPARAQGCIVARSAVQPIGPESGGGYLEPGEFDFTMGYRHQYSFRHFVGDVEQKQRIQIGNQVMNKINLENFNLTYQLTPRFSVTGSVPLLLTTTTAINPLTLTAYSSISDQYLMQAGIPKPIKRVRGLTVMFGPRWEGVPAKDVFGDSLGFRRPGYAVSLEPGFQYAHAKWMLTANVGKAIMRDRTRSIPDRITGGHGDAAFADYLWTASYSYRFGTPRGMEH